MVYEDFPYDSKKYYLFLLLLLRSQKNDLLSLWDILNFLQLLEIKNDSTVNKATVMWKFAQCRSSL